MENKHTAGTGGLSMVWLVFAVLFLVSFSGCVAEDKDFEDAVYLADHSECMFRMPGNETRPCPGEGFASLMAAPPEDWWCAEEVDYIKGVQWRLMSDGHGSYGLWFAADTQGLVAHLVMEIDDGERRELLVAEEGGMGFLAFEGIFGEVGTVNTALWTIAAEGTPDLFSTENLKVRYTMYGDEPWFLWSFEGEGQSAYFQSMARVEFLDQVEHVPVSMDETGKDFELRLGVDLPFKIGGEYVAQEPGVLGVWGNNCEAGLLPVSPP